MKFTPEEFAQLANTATTGHYPDVRINRRCTVDYSPINGVHVSLKSSGREIALSIRAAKEIISNLTAAVEYAEQAKKAMYGDGK